MINTIDSNEVTTDNELLKKIATELNPIKNSEELKLGINDKIFYISRHDKIISENLPLTNEEKNIPGHQKINFKNSQSKIMIGDEMWRHKWDIHWNWEKWQLNNDPREISELQRIVTLLNEELEKNENPVIEKTNDLLLNNLN